MNVERYEYCKEWNAFIEMYLCTVPELLCFQTVIKKFMK